MQPYERVREIRALQDRVAQGDVAAYTGQHELIARAAASFSKADKAVWKTPRNSNAAVIYVLSGGDPRFFRSLLRRGDALSLNKHLAKGALAYGEGRLKVAAVSLSKLDALTLDLSIAGNVALAQGLLSANNKPTAAMAFLNLARLLSPGTLIEESALRRQIALAAILRDPASFERFASTYLRRFPKSVFLPAALRKIVSGVEVGVYGKGNKGIERLNKILSVLPQRMQRDTFLAMASRAAVSGNITLAQWSARSAAALAVKGSADFIRSNVYQAAALVATPALGRGLKVLSSVDRSRLATRDAELLNAAMVLAGSIKRKPSHSDRGSARVLPIAEKARDMIAQVDRLLAGESQ